MQYSHLRMILGQRGESDRRLSVPVDLFNQLLIAALRSKAVFDEAYYLETNEDIRKAVADRRIPSAKDHYYRTGYFEGRLPCKLSVDEKFYLAENPDVVEAIRNGLVKSAQDHFDTAGFHEGRLPHPDFRLF